ncbi:hypothetical protein G4G27_00955 [Sphingomonas sp. So64.6b]|uniref:hypothetical protein n=1 Tax=Sphingomonas sp. So64.6b TaxID=2997354 RepID=UPI0015FF6005|nr:hypothetical protein [Sphingomonas sp. So64.6b]QNA82734.1 hypothetical protein G4G27_00955 [Sphingomonas sp. So64.6b]
MALSALILFASPATAQSDEEFDPAKVDVVDAINCAIDARDYMGFSITLGDEDSGYRKRGWIKQESGNPFLSQYRLPAPIEIGGHQTRTIVFSSNAVLAVLDIPDPNDLAEQEGIENVAPGSGKFLGEREMLNKVEKDPENGWTITTRITRNLSNVSSHPGKTLLGCSYVTDVKLPGEK